MEPMSIFSRPARPGSRAVPVSGYRRVAARDAGLAVSHNPYRGGHPMQRSRAALGLMLACSPILQACAPQATQAPPGAAAQAAPAQPSVADVISSDPRFSNFYSVIRLAGLR